MAFDEGLTRAQFLGGPCDGRALMIRGRPEWWQVEVFAPIPASITADVEWQHKVIVTHTYHRNDTRFMDGDMIAYEYCGDH